MDEIDSLKQSFEQQLIKINSPKFLEEFKIKYLGRNGIINSLLTKIKDVDQSERKNYGQKLNQLKTSIKHLIEEKYRIIVTKDKQEIIDYSLPGKKFPQGSLHVITYAIDEITKIFEKIGFISMSYPEVEWDYFAFESLNMPANHPARDDFETLFIDFPIDKKYGRMVLSPHTSSGQIREMWRLKKPPIRMINIAKCYRPNFDATHTPMFYQFEGLCIDKGINITHLKGTLDYFVKEYFGTNRNIRLRPFHFQFTEPSFEVDISCEICNGTGLVKNNKCRVCKSGWLELGGTGMVHPNVLKAGKVNPDLYTGWAFGFGIERVIMMKYKFEDIRNYYLADIRFLEQF